jgi:hypothetical protein
MKKPVRLFKIIAEQNGHARNGFIYAANENDALGLHANEWGFGSHDNEPLTQRAVFVIDTKAKVEIREGEIEPRFLSRREITAWHKKLEPSTYPPVRAKIKRGKRKG